MWICNGPQWKDSLFKIDVIILANYYNHLQNYLDKVFKLVHSACTKQLSPRVAVLTALYYWTWVTLLSYLIENKGLGSQGN